MLSSVDDSVSASGPASQKKKAADVEIITLESSDDEADTSEDDAGPPPAKRPYNPSQALPPPPEHSSQADTAPVITPSVACSLAQLPAATSVLPGGPNGTTAPPAPQDSNSPVEITTVGVYRGLSML